VSEENNLLPEYFDFLYQAHASSEDEDSYDVDYENDEDFEDFKEATADTTADSLLLIDYVFKNYHELREQLEARLLENTQKYNEED
jgi:iron-sulfur cluster repair protein YtfE (RIC family)